VVQFARGVSDGLDYALKFYVSKTAFDSEGQLYKNAAFAQLLPKVEALCMNEEDAETDAHGIPLPPFIVMEKGEALDEWSRRAKPDQFQSVAVCLSHTTRCMHADTHLACSPLTRALHADARQRGQAAGQHA
jgi:hypothetical protein